MLHWSNKHKGIINVVKNKNSKERLSISIKIEVLKKLNSVMNSSSSKLKKKKRTLIIKKRKLLKNKILYLLLSVILSIWNVLKIEWSKKKVE